MSALMNRMLANRNPPGCEAVVADVKSRFPGVCNFPFFVFLFSFLLSVRMAPAATSDKVLVASELIQFNGQFADSGLRIFRLQFEAAPFAR